MSRYDFKGEVLLCEDNEFIQFAITSQIAMFGLTVSTAYNGLECVDIVRGRMQKNEKPFDLIFMDILMPEMDGLEAARALNALGSKTPIVALSASDTEDDNVELQKECRIQDSLGKPFTLEELTECLLRYLPHSGGL